MEKEYYIHSLMTVLFERWWQLMTVLLCDISSNAVYVAIFFTCK